MVPPPSPSSLLAHPSGAGPLFATVPDIVMGRLAMPGGPVYLPYGRRNFGALHIWDRHAAEMARKGFHAFTDVPAFVARVVRPGAPLHFEGGSRDERLAVVQSVSGTAILQLVQRPGQDHHYSVVTVYLGFNRHGPRVGTLL